MNMLMQKGTQGLIFIAVLIHFSLYGDYSYILCFDGGGSKTLLQVINHKGQILPLTQNGKIDDQLQAGCSNINVVGKEGVRNVLQSLLNDARLASTEQTLISLLSDCYIVAGMAGAGLSQNYQTLVSLFEEWDISSPHILIMSDADLALKLIDKQGIVLIAGTGSICLGKKDQSIFRVGGLGRILGDEGSGYQIGLNALKAVLADEYGWGAPTELTSTLKTFFSVSELKVLIPQINSGAMAPSTIASIAPLVLTKASQGDIVAQTIMQHAVNDLCDLLVKMLQLSHLSEGELHVWGGIFKSEYASILIEQMIQQLPIIQQQFHIVNQADHNIALLFAIKFLCHVS